MDFTKHRTIAIYARVSTESETQLHALDNQIEWYNAYLKDKPNWNVYKLYKDPGISGTSLKKRKAFLQMIEDAQEKKFDLVLTREIPRFARNTIDALNYTRFLKSIGVEVYFAFEHLSSFENDEFVFTVLAAIAQKEAMRTSERVKAGQKIIRQKAVDVGATPYGYVKENKELLPDEKTAAVVRDIFDLYVSGEGIRKIAYKLEQEGHLTPKGKKHWTGTIINYILRNPVYKGLMVYNRYYVIDFLTHKVVKNHGEIEKTVVRGRHEPLIDANTFDLAQEILQSKAKLYGGTNRKRGVCPTKNIWQLRLLCGECGKTFCSAGSAYYKKRDGTSDRVMERRFICYTQREHGTPKAREKMGLDSICSAPPVWTNELKDIWREIIKYIRMDKDCIKTKLVSAIQKSVMQIKRKTSEQTDYLENNLKKLDAQYEKLLDAFLEGIIDKETFSIRSDGIKKEKIALQKELECGNVKSITCRTNTIIQRLDDILANEFDDQVLAEALIDKIVVYTDHYEWYVIGMGNFDNTNKSNYKSSYPANLNSDSKVYHNYSVNKFQCNNTDNNKTDIVILILFYPYEKEWI